MLSTPFIINTWFAGKIVDAIERRGQWRWEYGMFAIIMPVALGPAVTTLIYLNRKAKKAGLVNVASSNAAREHDEKQEHASLSPETKSWIQSVRGILDEIDAFGLVLLGFSWFLLLLPFSLKTYADGGWRNPSLIAMMIVGGLLRIAYIVYEMKWARVPSAPRRLVFNKTFIMSIVIDTIYLRMYPVYYNLLTVRATVAGNIYSLYWSSYVYVAKTWSYQNWVYYGNTLTLALCITGPIVGLPQRWTHRYKAIQITGLAIKIIGMDISLDGRQATDNTAALVISLILIGVGGCMSAVGCWWRRRRQCRTRTSRSLYRCSPCGRRLAVRLEVRLWLSSGRNRCLNSCDAISRPLPRMRISPDCLAICDYFAPSMRSTNAHWHDQGVSTLTVLLSGVYAGAGLHPTHRSVFPE